MIHNNHYSFDELVKLIPDTVFHIDVANNSGNEIFSRKLKNKDDLILLLRRHCTGSTSEKPFIVAKGPFFMSIIHEGGYVFLVALTK